ncbi:MAG: gliding motility-associated C-terminal domain-containing protein [Bacteroidota bacterium]|nr:gliding motility-associated C-terminal domain-containing protein [Bacteroidota bacterium]
MKRLTLFLFLLPSFYAGAQITCTVTPSDTIVCYKDSIAFTVKVQGSGTFAYQWMKNSQVIPFATDSLFVIDSVRGADAGYYSCRVISGLDTATSNRAHLRMHPQMTIDTLYRYNPLDCPGTCKGQFKVHVSGGTPPYQYLWAAGYSQDTIVFGLCKGTYTFTVQDSFNCKLSKDYNVDVLKMPNVTFDVKPGDTVYLSNPILTVFFPDSVKHYMTNWEWDFADNHTVQNENPANHTYTKTGEYEVHLNYTDQNSCDTTLTHIVYVKEAKLKIPNVFTPNGDGSNDDFMIRIEGNPAKDYREAFFNTELVVFDRWGKKVYEKNNYKSGDWKGDNLSDGAYFYILKCTGQNGTDVYRGSVTILTAN